MFNSELLNDQRVYELLVTVSARWVKYGKIQWSLTTTVDGTDIEKVGLPD